VGHHTAVDNCAEMVEVELENYGLTEQLQRFRRLRGLTDRCTVALGNILQHPLPGF